MHNMEFESSVALVRFFTGAKRLVHTLHVSCVSVDALGKRWKGDRQAIIEPSTELGKKLLFCSRQLISHGSMAYSQLDSGECIAARNPEYIRVFSGE